MKSLTTRLCALLLACLAPGPVPALEYHTHTLSLAGRDYPVTVPRGYRLEVMTTALDGPRVLTFGKQGELFIGARSNRVYRLSPPYTHPEVLLEIDNYPHSVAQRNGNLYIARTDGVFRLPYQPGQEDVSRERLEQVAPLPAGGGHSSRTIKLGPDGRLYVALGISGNCSDEYLGGDYAFRDRRGGILVLDETRSPPRWETVASGLRNPIGFDWHPGTGVMYASNNGPDHWGYHAPPEYFSRIAPGSFHGMPWFQYVDGELQRDSCISRPPPRPRREVTRPVAMFPARNAPMDVHFVPLEHPDARLAGNAIVALHGSWATQPTGGFMGDPATRRPPALMMVRFEAGQSDEVVEVVTGFQLDDGERWARPMGVGTGPDGHLYFTSDGGVEGLFRLRRLAGPGNARPAPASTAE